MALGDVTVTFPVTDTTLRNIPDLTLTFSIGGSGTVALDASTTKTVAAVQAVVNAWDSANVGMVTNPALFNTSCSLLGTATVSGAGNNISTVAPKKGVGVANALITGAGSEVISWKFSSGNDASFELKSFAYAERVATGDSNFQLSDNDTTTTYLLPLTATKSGTVSVSGFSLENNQTLSISTDPAKATSAGGSFYGFTFDVLPSTNISVAIGTDLTDEVLVVMAGSSTNFSWSGSASDTLTIGSAATILTVPDAGGTSPVELGASGLSLELGSQWILDGSSYSNTFTVGDRFELASYGLFAGITMGIRYRNFALPADRDLQLVNTSTSLYYEVVAQTAATGPNIIVVNVDDMIGGQHFAFEGRDCLSPTLDSLAANGIHFTEAFAASTVCGPSRYALMTGRWPSRNTSANYISKYPLGTLGRFGVSDTQLEDDGENIGAWLQRAGYRTGFVGKAHLIDDDLINTVNWPAKGLITYGQTDDPAVNPVVNGAMHHNHRVLSQRMRPYGFDFVGGFYRANLAELRNDALNIHNQEWITKNALDFIDENHSQRFFLYMAPTINHGPVRNDLSKSLLADPNYTSAGYRPNEDYSFMPTRAAIVNEVTTAAKDLISARETWVDYSIVAIMNKLAEHGISSNTLVIFTADHGEKTLPGVPLKWGKSSLFDSGMRVPLVMHWPNGISSPGRTYTELVQHTDLVPTFLELAGAANLPSRAIDGASLVPVLNGGNAALHNEVFCEIGYARGVRSKDWKYIAVRYTPSIYAQIDSGYLWNNFSTGLPTEPRPYYVNNSSLGYLTQNTHPGYYDDDQLYALGTDPDEQNNLYGQFPAVAYDLKKRLAGYIGTIPNRPFRQFSDASTEFSPAPSTVPAAPASVQMQFQGVNAVQLDWADMANNELGYIVQQSTNGTIFEIVSELPSGSNSTTVALDAGVEDIVLRVASYNVLGDSAAASDVDLLAPENWRYRTFGSTTSSNSQWVVDADSDGIETIWEYAFATDPLDSNSWSRINGELNPDGTNTWLQIVVPRDQRRDVTISGRVSTNLSDWAVGAPETEIAESTDTQLILRSTTPVADKPLQFIAAGITIP